MIQNKYSLFQNHWKFRWNLVHFSLNSLAFTECCDNVVDTSKPFQKWTINAHLALKDFCSNVSFGFLNRFTMYCIHVPQTALFGANTKNLANCGASFPPIILNSWIIISCSPMCLVHSFSTYLHSLFLQASTWKTSLLLLNYSFVALLYTISSFPMSGF